MKTDGYKFRDQENGEQLLPGALLHQLHGMRGERISFGKTRGRKKEQGGSCRFMPSIYQRRGNRDENKLLSLINPKLGEEE